LLRKDFPNLLSGLRENESGSAAIRCVVTAAFLSIVAVAAISATGNSSSSVIGT
jgi:Flp pilus assembly pilin Flp